MGDVQTKIRIFSLARELGIDSKLLIAQCNEAGIPVKSSALAAISPEEKQILLGHLQAKSGTTRLPAPAAPAVQRPTLNQVLGDVRDIHRDRSRRSLNEESPDSDSITPIELIAASIDSDPAVLEVANNVAPCEIAPSKEPEESAIEVSQESAVDDAVAHEVPQASFVANAMPRPKAVSTIAPIASRMREMRPVGSGSEAARFGVKQPSRAKPSLPALAEMPAFKAKAPSRDVDVEQKVQRPEIKLTPDQWNASGGSLHSPLAARMKQAEKGNDDASKEKQKTSQKRKTDFPDVSTKAVFTAGEDPVDETPRQRRARKNAATANDSEDEDVSRRNRAPRFKPKVKSKTPQLKATAKIESPILVRTLSEAVGRPAKSILAAMLKKGSLLTINDVISDDNAWEVCLELGVELEITKARSYEEDLEEIYSSPDPVETLQPRPPIVTILGHVDHGKTTLLDKLRLTNIAAGEAGGITQHIRAYQVNHNSQLITFVDTPGHAAFGEMRARGANVTDIVVLVIAIDDSVMPQTVECISHAKASGAPIIVALNKCDIPGAAQKEQKVLTDLANAGVQPHEWGGDVEVIRTSGVTGLGLDTLLETISLTSELNQFSANPSREAVGVCLEGFRDEGVGPIAWLIIQNGTLRIGDVVLCGATYGKIRSIYNDRGESVVSAGPATPVKISGLLDVPGAGDRLFVLNEIDLAREIASDRRSKGRHALLAGRRRPHTLDDVLNAAKRGITQQLNLVIKADAPGSIEALRHEIGRIEHPEVQARVIHDAVGGVNESDVYLASASDAVILAFHVSMDDRTQQLAEQEGVEIRRYSIIYEITDHIKSVLEGMLKPEIVRQTTGRAIVLQSFGITKVGTVAGCRVLSGQIERNHRISIIRDQRIIGEYGIASLKRHKDDAKEVREGMECGLRLEGFNDIKDGDLLEAFKMDHVKRTID